MRDSSLRLSRTYHISLHEGLIGNDLINETIDSSRCGLCSVCTLRVRVFDNIHPKQVFIFLYHYIWWSRYLCLSKKKTERFAVLLQPSVMLGKFSPRSLVSSFSGVVIYGIFFLKGHIYGRFRILIILPVSAKFWAKQNWRTKILYFGLKVFCFIFIAKNGGTVVRLKLFIDIFWISFTHMLKIPWWCGSLKCFHNWFT